MIIDSLPHNVRASDIPPERLAGNTSLTEEQKIAEASRQFEAVLLRQILTSTQKTVIPSKFVDNSTSAEIYRDMITTQLADSISKSGSFGLARTFENQLVPRAHRGSEPHGAAPTSSSSQGTVPSGPSGAQNYRAAGVAQNTKPHPGHDLSSSP